jgi:type I restriction enzyme M protein
MTGGSRAEVGVELTLADVARLAEVSVSAVSNWRSRHADFPRPVSEAGPERFARAEVARWLSGRKIPRNGLRRGETLGTTYGDRFDRNSGPTPTTLVPALPGGDESQPVLSALWQLIGALRYDLSPELVLDTVLVLLYVRKTDHQLWRSVVQGASWDAINRKLDTLAHETGMLFFGAKAAPVENRRLRAAVAQFDKIHIDDSEWPLLADALMERIHRDFGKYGGRFTPSGVARAMVSVLELKENVTVYDPSCGSGELLVAAGRAGEVSLYGEAANPYSLRMARFVLALHGQSAELGSGEPHIQDGAFADRRFDRVLSNPPFAGTLPESVAGGPDRWPFGVPGTRTAEFAWLQVAVSKLRPGGRAAVLTSNGPLFMGGSGAKIRGKMLEAGVVEGIIAFPAGLFAATKISVSLWVLRKPEHENPPPSTVVFVDAREVGRGGYPRILEEADVGAIVQEYLQRRDADATAGVHSTLSSRTVGVAEIREHEYELQPQQYLQKQNTAAPVEVVESLHREMDEQVQRATRTRSYVDRHLAGLAEMRSREWKQVRLGDVCEIHAGPGSMDREPESSRAEQVAVVLPRNIKRGFISHDRLEFVNPTSAAQFSRYRLEPGDIACPRSGTLGAHGLVREAESGWLLGPSCIRLRVTSAEVLPEYLVYFLNGPHGQRWVADESGGSVIQTIRTTVMRDMPLAVPPAETQRDVVATLESIELVVSQHQQVVSTAQALWVAIFPALYTPST